MFYTIIDQCSKHASRPAPSRNAKRVDGSLFPDADD
jgi:hypothetical protein